MKTTTKNTVKNRSTSGLKEPTYLEITQHSSTHSEASYEVSRRILRSRAGFPDEEIVPEVKKKTYVDVEVNSDNILIFDEEV